MELNLKKDIFDYVVEWDKEFKAILPVVFKDKNKIATNPQVLVNYYPDNEEFSFELFEEDEQGTFDSEHVLHTYMKDMLKDVVRTIYKLRSQIIL